MTIVKVEIRRGAYYDSVILMQLQRSLAHQPGVVDAGVVMGTNANKEVLQQSNMRVAEVEAAGADDLVLVVVGQDEASAQAALNKVDELVASRRSSGGGQDYRPRSIETAARMLPNASWVLVSVPGRYAADQKSTRLNYSHQLISYTVFCLKKKKHKKKHNTTMILITTPELTRPTA